MDTTIQISEDLRNVLQVRKLSDRESYENIIWDLLEDSMELSDETKKSIKESEEDIKKGRTVSLEEIKKKFLKNVQNRVH